MTDEKKRNASPIAEDSSSNKRTKGKRRWHVPRHSSTKTGEDGSEKSRRREIEPGDAGIWATCDMKREAKAVVELRNVFEEHAEKLHGTMDGCKEEKDAADDEHIEDIEAEVKRELEELQKPSAESALFTSIRLDTQCLLFFKTGPQIEPVSFVESLCKGAADPASRSRSRVVRRLTPVTLIGKATEKGIDEVAGEVLAPHFHAPEASEKKFAIRVNLRNSTLRRDDVIRQVAAAVGPGRGHSVDLKNYDVLILVEIYKNICGMSVVSNEYEALKRFNLAEIYATEARVSENI